jgi:hypothetical protein
VEGGRWNPPELAPWVPPCLYKQFIKVGNYPNITRTMVMLRQLEEEDITVIAPIEFLPYVEGYAKMMVSLKEDTIEHLHQGIKDTYRLWKNGDRVVFLYGDVIYSWDTLEKILSHTDERVSFFGRKGHNTFTGKVASEIFALSVPKHLIREFYRKIVEGWKEKRTRIWSLTYTDKTSDYIEIDSYTDDVDSPQEYQQFYPILNQLATEDDRERI